MKKLSIVIPIYNVAPYVERCIRSLEDQDISHGEYELICVNDGSIDNSAEIIEQLQKEYLNIILINQENKGVSMARNRGIEIATGKYLLFIDADDYVKPNMLNEKINYLFKYDLDVGITGFFILNTDLKEEYLFDLPNTNEVLSGIEFSYNYTRGRSEIRDPHRSVAIFFKTTFLKANELNYLPGVPYLEDGEFIYRVLCKAKRVNYIAEPFYFRTTRPGSATQSGLFSSNKAIKGFIKAANNLKEFQKSNFLSTEQRSFLNQPLVMYCLTAASAFADIGSIHKIFWVRKQLIKNKLYRLNLNNCSIFYTRYGRYYNRSIYLFLFNYLLFKVRVSIKSKFKQLGR